jgi:hypothetical protein
VKNSGTFSRSIDGGVQNSNHSGHSIDAAGESADRIDRRSDAIDRDVNCARAAL